MTQFNYSVPVPSVGMGLRAPAAAPYQDSFSSWNPQSYQAPVTPGGYGGLNFDWNTSNMGGDGFQVGNLGGYGLQDNGLSLATPNLTGGMGTGANSGGGGWNWLNTRDQQGVLGPALAGAQSLASLFMGMKQYGLAKDQLAFQKDSFNKQYDTNRTLTNSRLEDRQKARVASNASAYQSVGDYMNQNGVK